MVVLDAIFLGGGTPPQKNPPILFFLLKISFPSPVGAKPLEARDEAAGNFKMHKHNIISVTSNKQIYKVMISWLVLLISNHSTTHNSNIYLAATNKLYVDKSFV